MCALLLADMKRTTGTRFDLVAVLAFFVLLSPRLSLLAVSGDMDVQVSLQAPASNYALKINEVFHVENEIWAVAKIQKAGDFGASVITQISDSVKVLEKDVPKGPDGKSLPLKLKVLGKAWSWGKSTDTLQYISATEEAAFLKKLLNAHKIPFKRAK